MTYCLTVIPYILSIPLCNGLYKLKTEILLKILDTFFKPLLPCLGCVLRVIVLLEGKPFGPV